ncbi:MAG: type III-A CRISPR-associated protein Cas10/Csm1, partial [Clostridiales bacterium]|nr:type III-A CRISPR-associated protein Cas10/Csm1 [Clostridiales bacterium]
NILNNNGKSLNYPNESTLESGLPFATNTEDKYLESFYKTILQNLNDNIHKNIETNELMDILEANTSFVPSSTSLGELADISLFDHSKTTAAIGACIYQYLGARNYKDVLFSNNGDIDNENIFLLTSCDFSGIQDFIYTTSGKRSLKSLRSRSFYLEIMLEHMADELLSSLGLARPNLLYTGGGHAYFLLPNTDETKTKIEEFVKQTKIWFLENFKTALYVAFAYNECNAKQLSKNIGEVYKKVSEKMSVNKQNRYDANDIIMLNSQNNIQNERECRICHRTDKLEDDICEICSGIEDISVDLARSNIFMVVNSPRGKSLPLPYNKFLIVSNELGDCERFYVKNKLSAGAKLSRNIWMGDYFAKGGNGKPLSFEDLAEGVGIKRIGVLRADVDDLGKAFSCGFNKRHATISRTAALSRSLSLFFKWHINKILDGRNATIVYSGGDDVFIVGHWLDIIEIGVELQSQFAAFTGGALTISAGVGMYDCKYPFLRQAIETGELESAAKADGKNRIALFEHVFVWDEFRNNVLGKKLKEIEVFFADSDERGKNFIYRIAEYLREMTGVNNINLARFAYLLARLNIEQDNLELLYEYAKNEKDRKELMCALEIYVYKTREGE